jgi:hypothetical protein
MERNIAPVVTIKNLHDKGSDFAYWQKQTPQNRIDALEQVREEYNFWKYGTNKDLKEFVAILNSNDVRYLVIGGYALAFHGHPRYTKDLDIWIENSPGNAEKLLCALTEFGFGSLGVTCADLTKADQIIQLGYPPNRIDLLTSADGLDFAPCYQRRKVADISGIAISFISLPDLKLNKQASARPQDLADLDALD